MLGFYALFLFPVVQFWYFPNEHPLPLQKKFDFFSTNMQVTSYINLCNKIKLFHRPVIFPNKINTAKKQTFNKGMNDVLENN